MQLNMVMKQTTNKLASHVLIRLEPLHRKRTLKRHFELFGCHSNLHKDLTITVYSRKLVHGYLMERA
jgi:hypothetical protein